MLAKHLNRAYRWSWLSHGVRFNVQPAATLCQQTRQKVSKQKETRTNNCRQTEPNILCNRKECNIERPKWYRVLPTLSYEERPRRMTLPSLVYRSPYKTRRDAIGFINVYMESTKLIAQSCYRYMNLETWRSVVTVWNWRTEVANNSDDRTFWGNWIVNVWNGLPIKVVTAPHCGLF